MFQIELDGRVVSEPYVRMTIAMMSRWGLIVERKGDVFDVPCRCSWDISTCKESTQSNPDASAASYF